MSCVRLTIDAPEVNNPRGFCGVAANGDANRGHAYKALESAVPRGKRTQLRFAKPKSNPWEMFYKVEKLQMSDVKSRAQRVVTSSTVASGVSF